MASRNQNLEKMENPCKKFFDWITLKEKVTVGDDEFTKVKGGTWKWWDSEAENKDRESGKGKAINMELPFKFAVLNPDLVSWKAYDKPNKRNIWSNEVILSKDNGLFDAKAKVLIQAGGEGLYEFTIGDYLDKAGKQAETKKKVKETGAKFTQSIYICFFNENGEIELGNLQLKGGALTGAQDKDNKEDREDGWYAFKDFYGKGNDLFKYWIVVDDYKLKKKEDGGKYTIPVYKRGALITEEEGRILANFDNELTEYLKSYFKFNAAKISSGEGFQKMQDIETQTPYTVTEPEDEFTGR